ncbi:glycosyltransferase family 4 protein [Georgenia faecalis]|uniref:glycosyltransferase family 4 protein n=1 Tax=Georgenia faecalis TaxID=2483799 RepID=UPI0019D0F4A4|nr:glycosyltransferase family 4 protein [Georgenia faecalis]
MRVLQLTSSSAGGVARHAHQVADLLARPPRRPGTLQVDEGDQVILAGPPDVLAGAPVPGAVVDIADRPRPSDVVALARLRRLAAHADVVHAHGLRAGAAAVLALRTLRDRPALVVTVHNAPVGGAGVRGVAAALERVVARGADVVLGVSGDLVERMDALGARDTERALVPAPARRVAPGAAPGTATLLALGLGQGERLVLTVARLAPQKGLDLLCDASALVRDRAPGVVRWVVVGDGPLEEHLQARIDAERLPVRLAGRRDDVPELLTRADVVVSTALWEGQPLAVQEALQAGAAVVATDVGGTAEVTGDAAVLVPPRAEAIADAVVRVLGDDGERDRLRQAARQRAADLPGPNDVHRQLRDVYSRALGHRC